MNIELPAVLVAIVGLIMWVFLTPISPKGAEIGKVMFAAGLLAVLLHSPGVMHIDAH